MVSAGNHDDDRLSDIQILILARCQGDSTLAAECLWRYLQAPNSGEKALDSILWQLHDGRGPLADRAYEAIFRHYEPRLVPFAKKFLGNQEDAHNAVQEVFLNLYVHRHNPKEGWHLSAFLYTSTRNQALNQLRRNRREVPFDAPGEEEDAPLFEPKDPSPLPDQELMSTLPELAARLKRTCPYLEFREVEHILLRKILHYCTREVIAYWYSVYQKEVSESVERTSWFRVKQKLKECRDRFDQPNSEN